MKDPKTNLKALIKFREALGVSINESFSIQNKLSPIEKIKASLEEIEGISVNENEIEKLLDGALLSYKGVLSILYIADTNKTEEYLKDDNLIREGKSSNEEEKSPKFHFTWCKTLEQKKTDGSFKRYVMLRNKSGRFIVHAKEDRYSPAVKVDKPVKLFACRYCLDGALGIKADNKSGYKGYSMKWDELDKRKAVNNFNIQSYLEENESVLNDIKYKTEHEDKTAPLNNYSNHWPEISRQVREKNSWKCQKCSIDLSRNKKLLHTHHKNHIKSDNSQANLVALCALCHKGNHAHMKIPENDRKYILNNRPK